MHGSERSSITALSEALRARKVSPVELTEACLATIDSRNSELNAFITVTADTAMEQAHAAEVEISEGKWRGPLHGVPIGLKDLIDIAGVRTTAASGLYKNRVPNADAPVVKKLRDAGAVLLGKQNLHEFAYGGSSMISYFGEVHNPCRSDFIAGGSSGGSAAAVKTGMGLAAIGTDTAGSIREPSALCGVVGFKPTYGRVSAEGVVPLSKSLDHVGPITKTVRDAALLFQVIAEAGDEFEPDFASGWDRSSERLRVGVARSFFFDDLDTEVANAVESALQEIRAIAKEVREVTLAPDNDRTVQAAESFAFHADSVARSPELYQPETLRRIRTGEKITREDYERRYKEMLAAREAIRKIFDTVDVIATPTTPIPAPSISELKQNPDLLRPRELVLLRNTRPWNVWCVPAISIPCGMTKSGLPIGLQIAGAPGRDEQLLQFAHACERLLPTI